MGVHPIHLRWLTAAMATLIGLIAVTTPASAISNGSVDKIHAYAGALIVESPNEPIQGVFCSGVLISPNVFLTGGHCTESLATHGVTPAEMFVSFGTNALQDRGSWRAVATYETDPDFTGFMGATDQHDLGAVILAGRVGDVTPAALATNGYLDGLEASGVLTHAVTFSVVGYGYNTFPVLGGQLTGDRKIALSGFRTLLDPWLVVFGNSALGLGGACWGDSGGPVLYASGTTDIVVALVSWGETACGSEAFMYRTDTTSALTFINAEVRANP